MALDSVPPWLDVHPGQFVQAVEAGNKTGLDLASLVQRGQISADELAERKSENEAEQGLQQQKLALTQSEGAAERSLRQNLQQHAQELAQQKFGTNVMLREAGQQIQKARAETAAHAAIISAMQRQKAQENEVARWDQLTKSRTATLEETQRHNQAMENLRSQGGGKAGITETQKITDPNNLFGGNETTLRGSPEAVEAELKRRSGVGASGSAALQRLQPGAGSQAPTAGGGSLTFVRDANGNLIQSRSPASPASTLQGPFSPVQSPDFVRPQATPAPAPTPQTPAAPSILDKLDLPAVQPPKYQRESQEAIARNEAQRISEAESQKTAAETSIRKSNLAAAKKIYQDLKSGRPMTVDDQVSKRKKLEDLMTGQPDSAIKELTGK